MKTRKKQIEAPATSPRRKAKFQADLAPAEDRSVRLLKEELQLSSNSDFLSDAVALFRWAVSARKLGHRIMSESASGEQRCCSFRGWNAWLQILSCHVWISNGLSANWKVLLTSYLQGKRTALLMP